MKAEWRQSCFFLWLWRDSETGCRKSTSNRDFEPQLWGNFIFVREANFYLKAIAGRSTRNKYCHVSWATTLGEGNVCSRTCHAPTAPLFWVAVLGSCLLRAADNSSVPIKSFLLGFWGFLLLWSNSFNGLVFSETGMLTATAMTPSRIQVIHLASRRI